MSGTDKADIFRGMKVVTGADQVKPVAINNPQQTTSGTMTSAKTQDDSAPPSQGAQNPPANSLSLSSLANALEPNNAVSNQQQPAVGTFPQRSAPTATNQASPFGQSFGQSFANGSNGGFSFSKAPPDGFAGFASQNQPPNLTHSLSFTNSQLHNPSTANAQSISSRTVMPSSPKQGVSDGRSNFSPPALRSPNSTLTQSTGSPKTSPATFQKNQSYSPQSGMRSWAVAAEEQEPAADTTSPADQALLSKKINSKLVDQSNLVVDRSDPTSPLFSLKSFQDLHLNHELLKGIYSMGFQSPSKIQEIALPHLLGNPPRNIIAQSQSGTGKTAAFSIALLSRIDPSIKSVQALIIAPTFELALQIGSVIEAMTKFLPYIKIAYAVRNTTAVPTPNFVRGQLLSESIVIGTPGTIEEWWGRRKVIDLSKLRICCIDEADVMIATQNFQDLCVNIVRCLDPAKSQIMLFSATYSDEVMTFARQIVPNPVVLRLKREKQTLNNIRQFFIQCYDAEHKFQIIEEIYAHLIVGQAMIFCRTKATARDLNIRMANQQHSVRELTSALDIEQRASVIRQFRERIFNVLISTNVTARGIDIDDVSLVINYDMPVTTEYKPDYETYLHRIGRCGRFGKLGYTFNLLGSEKDMEIMRSIEQYFEHPIEEITIDQISNLEKFNE